MTIEVIGMITLALGVICLFQPVSFIIHAFVCSILLGAAAAFTLPSLGGTNVTPSHLLLGFLTIRILAEPGCRSRLSDALAIGTPGFWLALIVIDCLVSAYFMPRLFAGDTFVYPVRTTGYMVVLQPATSNFTQSVYLVGDLVCFVLIWAYATSYVGRSQLGSAAILCVAANLAFSVVDLATYYSNTTEILSFIRNASYGLLTEVELAGSKRLVGSFTEASAFGSMTVAFFAFTFQLWLCGVYRRLSLVLAVLSLGAALLSKSSTAYVGLAVVLGIFYFQIVSASFSGALRIESMVLLAGAPFVVAFIILGILADDRASSYVADILNELVLNKLSSSSGVERSLWNRQGLENFFDTFGFGVGNGSMRASSFPIAVLASLGVVGSILFVGFFLSVFLAKDGNGVDARDEGYRKAAKVTCAAMLVTQVLAGALTDLGLPFFIFAALACAKRDALSRVRSSTSLALESGLGVLAAARRSGARGL
ncbi:hypothetical protein DYI24_14760 [Rhodopseudomonas sp. BR0C11]|jgi:hypothetical protein|uniref:hypothetical protein n=1 Tax=Rhodopseudomonas sp. BR0C11 TaxID=2269370 RepID=UPI0013E08E87|nr:hypothetical protein [Rhodopseudomonas sp. BR0C11]NEV78301.1 hypothetical protein [Rhodopseudomonas sp. BR0C11]